MEERSHILRLLNQALLDVFADLDQCQGHLKSASWRNSARTSEALPKAGQRPTWKSLTHSIAASKFMSQQKSGVNRKQRNSFVEQRVSSVLPR